MPTQANDDHLTEKCAVFAVYGAGLEAARLAFYGLWSLQHRGQESSGITTSDGEQLYRHGAPGLVAHVYTEENLESLHGHIAIGHNRYSTSGGQDDRFVQPIIDKEHGLALAHNGNLPDCTKLIHFLSKKGIDTSLLNDSGMMTAAIGWYLGKGHDLTTAVRKAYPLFTGVFSSVAMTKDTVVTFRDKCGIRPLSIATLDGGYIVSSETCAFDTIGATFLRDVEPGELVTITADGITSEQVVKADPKLDIFEFVYFARPDSMILGKRVDVVRKNFGRQMAKEFPIDADVVIPVPDSAIPASVGYAQASNIPFEMGLIKNRYIHRTFIRPTAKLRERDLKMKLNPVVELIKGKRVVLIDDSIVRGTTLRKVVAMVFEAGAKEVHVAISSPPVRYPDFYGINTPTQTELLAATMDVEGMCGYIGATSLNFLSQDGMVEATGLPATSFSSSCFDGIYPIEIGSQSKTIGQKDIIVSDELTKKTEQIEDETKKKLALSSHAV